MPTAHANSPASETATPNCPLCDAPLDPKNLNECPKCDWVRESSRDAAGTFRDRMAVLLSVVPGLGHFYKGHKLTGALYFLGAVFAAIACTVAATFTAGFGILLLPLYWVGIMLQVYWLEDRGLDPVKKA